MRDSRKKERKGKIDRKKDTERDRRNEGQSEVRREKDGDFDR